MLLTEPVLDVIRRELRRISPDVKIDIHQISKVLAQEVVKREVLEGDKADEARRRIIKVTNRAIRKAKDTAASEDVPVAEVPVPTPPAPTPPAQA